jgi:hypothetical protein
MLQYAFASSWRTKQTSTATRCIASFSRLWMRGYRQATRSTNFTGRSSPGYAGKARLHHNYGLLLREGIIHKWANDSPSIVRKLEVAGNRTKAVKKEEWINDCNGGESVQCSQNVCERFVLQLLAFSRVVNGLKFIRECVCVYYCRT